MLAETQTIGAGVGLPQSGYRLWSKTGGDTTYLKENPLTGIRTYLTFTADGLVKVTKTQRVDRIVDRNVRAQNDFRGFKATPMVQIASVPWVVDQQLKTMAGFDPVTKEYDRDRYNSLLDTDYQKLKTIPGKIGRQLKEI
jgi:hypothetical protein